MVAIGYNLKKLTHLYIFMNDYTSGVMTNLIQGLPNLDTLYMGNNHKNMNLASMQRLTAQWKGNPDNLKIQW